MPAILNPYLSFNGGVAEAAMTFYQSIFGGELEIMRFSDMGGMGMPEDQQSRVMHSALTNAEIGLHLFGSDAAMGDVTAGDAVSIALSGDDVAVLTGWFDGLAAGGTVSQPLLEAPWGDRFGQVTDKFGVGWMVNISAPKS